jgi:hypothetical protein
MRRPLIALLAGLTLSLNVQAAAPGAFTAFAGRWAGRLEYQDYGANKRVKIPVKLSVRPQDATNAAWTFSYDDFGTTVSSLETHTFAGGRYSVSTIGKPEVQMYTSSDFATLGRIGTGKAVLLGQELENGKKVQVRRTITLGKTTLSTLTETRSTGGQYGFRNLSTYTRQP